MDAQIRQLRDDARAHPDDLEIALFLAEAQQRTGDSAGAITTLKDLLARVGTRRAYGAARDVAVEAGFALVHLLKRTGQLDEAVARLDDIARLAPGRAREAHLQIADIALARYDVTRALSHADAAAASADPQTLARVGDLQARAGADDLAIATYRAAVARDANPAATLALARLLVRRGDEREAADALDGLLRTSRDDDAITEAGRLAIELADLRGRLPELESRAGGSAGSRAGHAGAPQAAGRRCSSACCRRCTATRARTKRASALGRRVLRPLLEIITEAEQTPDRAIIELVGMLGNGDAAPALVRLAIQDKEPAGRTVRALDARAGGWPARTPTSQLAALVALARLRRPARPRPAFARFRGIRPAIDRLRAAAHLGPRPPRRRAGGARADQGARRPPARGGRGRLPRPRPPPGADRVCRRCSRWRRTRGGRPRRRRAAILGPRPRGHAQRRRPQQRVAGRCSTCSIPAMPELAQAAGAGAGVVARSARAAPAAVARAAAPPLRAERRQRTAGGAGRLAGLGRSARRGPPARRERSIDVDALLAARAARRRRTSTPLWRGHTRELQDLLADALARGGDARHEALDRARLPPRRPALGALTPEADVALSPETAAAVREIVLPLADKLAVAARRRRRRTRGRPRCACWPSSATTA